ncbi:hypothetical protein BS17DRAFT_695336 [Gyrodon lividus]|nr:hypothetical protein BS17DRAFT_695336 [Gyrodon lividus]
MSSGTSASCHTCIVLPVGLQHVVSCLDEPTGWIHRGWTLQETLAPKDTVVLFLWKNGPGAYPLTCEAMYNGYAQHHARCHCHGRLS